jgi:hypothetical protein
MRKQSALFLLLALISTAAWSDTVVLICEPSISGLVGTSFHEISFDEAAEKVWIDGFLYENSKPPKDVTFTKTIIAVRRHNEEWNLNRVTGAWHHHGSRNNLEVDEGGICRVARKTKF